MGAVEGNNVFTATGEVVVASSELRFRSRAELIDSLIDAGFTVEHVYGDWDPLTPADLAEVMVGFDAPWWVVGGYALDFWTHAERNTIQCSRQR